MKASFVLFTFSLIIYIALLSFWYSKGLDYIDDNKYQEIALFQSSIQACPHGANLVPVLDDNWIKGKGWRTRILPAVDGLSELYLLEGTIFFTTKAEGFLYTICNANGQILNSQRFSEEILTGPIKYHDSLYIIAYRLESGLRRDYLYRIDLVTHKITSKALISSPYEKGMFHIGKELYYKGDLNFKISRDLQIDYFN